MSSEEQETYITRLAKMGYCWQFITLAGLHTTALISGTQPPPQSLHNRMLTNATDTFAKAYAHQGMKAYGLLVQEPEMENGVDVVTHQKWSGANYVDNMLKMVTGGVSSTAAMGKEVTETQFEGFTKN